MKEFDFHRTRLAPSPTGALHLGHARTFLLTWLLARQAHAHIILRMEDLDYSRAKPESVQQAYDDLHWLGLDWDRGPQDSEDFVQSHRLPLYAQTLDQLWQSHHLYPCTCTRADIAASVASSAGAPQEGDPHARYDGTCREKWSHLRHLSRLDAQRQVKSDTGKKVCWRLRVPTVPIPFTDRIAGPHSFDVSADSGDFPLTRFDSSPAYQLACVVDDHHMAINAVIRGNDLLPSTPRQLLLYQALDWQPPQFAHVPLVIGPDGKRLAKRHGESRIAQFRAAGASPETILGWAAWRSGQLQSPQKISAKELLSRFDLAKLPPAPVVLGPEDFTWLTTK